MEKHESKAELVADAGIWWRKFTEDLLGEKERFQRIEQQASWVKVLITQKYALTYTLTNQLPVRLVTIVMMSRRDKQDGKTRDGKIESGTIHHNIDECEAMYRTTCL